MQPDLTPPPGPWWGAPIEDERAEVGWYREFYDVRRNREIPEAEQKFRMQQSRDWIRLKLSLELSRWNFLPAGTVSRAVGRIIHGASNSTIAWNTTRSLVPATSIRCRGTVIGRE
jgi:hypothetical protein